MKIDYETRKKLLEFIQGGCSISHAAKKMGLKESTARAIFVNYKENQVIFEKKGEKKERLRKEKEITEMNFKEQTPKDVHGNCGTQVQQQLVPPQFSNTYLVSYQMMLGPQPYNFMPWM